jgi:hypothetical protein
VVAAEISGDEGEEEDMGSRKEGWEPLIYRI